MRIAYAALAAAIALAGCKTTEPAIDAGAPLQTPAPTAPRFDAAIADFEKADKAAIPPRCATLFVGSSTVRRWVSLKEDFPTRTVINRGFGGSTAWEVDAYFAHIVPPYHPKEIVYYAGDNDLSDVPARDGQPRSRAERRMPSTPTSPTSWR